MKVKTCDLTGAALDWAVGTANHLRLAVREGLSPKTFTKVKSVLSLERVSCDHKGCAVAHFKGDRYHPSSNWDQAGPLLEQEGIGFQKMEGEHVFQAWKGTCIEYACWPEGSFYAEGPTPLVAAMRCLVLARLGAEVEVPEELT